MSSVRITKNIFAQNGATNGLYASNLETALKIEANAKAACPVDFGELRNTIMTLSAKEEHGFNDEPGQKAPEDQKLSVNPKGTDVYTGTASDHWYPEFGTRFMEAQPFERPAGEIVAGSPPIQVIKKYNSDEMRKAFTRKRVINVSR